MMKNYIIGLIAIVIAIIGQSFKRSEPVVEKSKKIRATYYFKYIGIPGVQENDETQWIEITQAEYDNSLSLPNCFGPHKGCKLKTNQINFYNGNVIPFEVTTTMDYSTGNAHLDPVPSAFVAQVKNKGVN